VHAAKLRDGVVSVFCKDLRVKSLCAGDAHVAVGDRRTMQIAQKLVEE
jgi:hypothetical protein